MCLSAVICNSAFLKFEYFVVLGQILYVWSKNVVFTMCFFGTGESCRIEKDFACFLGLLIAMKMLFSMLLDSFIVKALIRNFVFF